LVVVLVKARHAVQHAATVVAWAEPMSSLLIPSLFVVEPHVAASARGRRVETAKKASAEKIIEVSDLIEKKMKKTDAHNSHSVVWLRQDRRRAQEWSSVCESWMPLRRCRTSSSGREMPGRTTAPRGATARSRWAQALR
jgi:hypothetical protein